MNIKAYAIKNTGGKAAPFSYERKVGKNDVLIKITHCGIARGDIQIIDDDWGDTKFPLVPGHEMIGIIEETGSEVIDLKNGNSCEILTSKTNFKYIRYMNELAVIGETIYENQKLNRIQ